ncbi:ABC transporter permease [Frankia sp. CNm7]|uniref:Transport permease protein n=1 Tax=Frankia nepalensis TaxID=1836974 RepID=A0A937RP53_9ACTN|nr:ABC transporter permease [Frankia nepalensis]MBL7501890.1 ABC transporter permease [Frankia nepalensis]MBL7511631.1 ABC transporter permease [Frankia nepalensis]MBL7523663.1 ABC transporter permease [Frankia nepalensis]MBL7633622.1 ABC transporter permease [Frankia nepalensis]
MSTLAGSTPGGGNLPGRSVAGPGDGLAPISLAGRARFAMSDAWTLALRVLLYYRHSPGLIVASLAAPLAMLVVFGYIFGSAMRVPGEAGYRDYLMPGLFTLIAVNGIMPSMTGAARDVGRGVTDRLRTLPISRSAALFGQTVADLAVSAVVLALLLGMGLALGWRAHDGLASAAAAVALLLLFRFVTNWIGIGLGLVIGREDTAAQLSVLVFPLAMVTNVFVPTGGMPGWLRVIADWNPISAVAAAARDLFGNEVPSTSAVAWPLEHPVAATLAWSALLLAVFVPLAVRAFTTHGR